MLHNALYLAHIFDVFSILSALQCRKKKCSRSCIQFFKSYCYTLVWFNAVIRFYIFVSSSVETEEAALLHEEATMTIEELLARYGQNRNAVKHVAALR